MITYNFLSAPNGLTLKLIGALFLLAVTACSSVNSSFGTLLEPERIDYNSASKATTSKLEVPPDLTQLQSDNRYALPDADRGVTTASKFSESQTTVPTQQTAAITPKGTRDIRLERSGNQRWLVVKQTPEELWPQV